MLNVAVVGQLLPSESFIWVVLQTAVQEFQPRCGKLYCLWNLVSSSCDVFLEILYANTCEGRETGDHLVVEATKRPNVRSVVVEITTQALGRHDQWGTAVCLSQLLFR